MNSKIEKGWNNFKDSILSSNIPNKQLTDFKIAYYGGAVVMAELIKEIADPRNKDINLDSLITELTAIDKFLEKVHNERTTGYE